MQRWIVSTFNISDAVLVNSSTPLLLLGHWTSRWWLQFLIGSRQTLQASLSRKSSWHYVRVKNGQSYVTQGAVDLLHHWSSLHKSCHSWVWHHSLPLWWTTPTPASSFLRPPILHYPLAVKWITTALFSGFISFYTFCTYKNKTTYTCGLRTGAILEMSEENEQNRNGKRINGRERGS